MNKNKLIMLRGLPASGKSTWAKKQVAKSNGNVKRINKDDLRSMLDDGERSKGNEKMVIKTRDTLIKLYLTESKTVIVDDTNFAPFHKPKLQELADHFDVEFEIKDFDTDVDVCMERDKKREKPVGKRIIMDMYNKYIAEEVKVNEKGDVVIFDIDGTLARMTGRSPYDYTQVHTDVVVPQVRAMLHQLSGVYEIAICTGRNGICEKETKQWLNDNDIPYDMFFTRAEDDNRCDSIVKKEMLDKIGRENVFAVFDDRPRVVRMRRAEGLFVFNVGSGREF